jgi:hypothetical protein
MSRTHATASHQGQFAQARIETMVAGSRAVVGRCGHSAVTSVKHVLAYTCLISCSRWRGRSPRADIGGLVAAAGQTTSRHARAEG